MSYLNKMYGRNSNNSQPAADKNPNRVTGGLRAQGVDRFTMIAEDGSKQEIPTLEYVRSLEEQSKKQRAVIDVLQRRLTRLETAQGQFENFIKNRSS